MWKPFPYPFSFTNLTEFVLLLPLCIHFFFLVCLRTTLYTLCVASYTYNTVEDETTTLALFWKYLFFFWPAWRRGDGDKPRYSDPGNKTCSRKISREMCSFGVVDFCRFVARCIFSSSVMTPEARRSSLYWVELCQWGWTNKQLCK